MENSTSERMLFLHAQLTMITIQKRGKYLTLARMYSLIPHYHKHYRVDLGPLYSCFALNVFDGSSKYAFLDPAFQEIVKKISDGEFGATDGLYGV